MSFDPAIVGTCGLIGLAALILLRVPIGIAMVAVGIVALVIQIGWQPALTILVNDPSASLMNLDLATIPLFLLMGAFATLAGLSSDIFAVATAFLGHRRGGLAYATIGGSAVFGSVCGSSPATAATFARIALPEMLDRRYEPGFAAGTVAAGGALKNLIPPSIVMVLYCIASGTFILDLFLAAVLPAILGVVLNFIAIAVVARVYPERVPVSQPLSVRARLVTIWQAKEAVLLLALVFGGLYSGTFTVNEAASVAAVTSLIFALLRGRLSWSGFCAALSQSAGTTVMIYVIIFGATIFSYSMSLAHVPDALVKVVTSLPVPALAIVFAILITYLVIGAIFDEFAAMLITLPFVLPVIVKLGYDPVWWGIVNVVIVELGMIVPPIGIIVLILHSMQPKIGLGAIYRGTMPYIIADICLLVLIGLFPIIVLWLPSMAR